MNRTAGSRSDYNLSQRDQVVTSGATPSSAQRLRLSSLASLPNFRSRSRQMALCRKDPPASRAEQSRRRQSMRAQKKPPTTVRMALQSLPNSPRYRDQALRSRLQPHSLMSSHKQHRYLAKSNHEVLHLSMSLSSSHQDHQLPQHHMLLLLHRHRLRRSQYQESTIFCSMAASTRVCQRISCLQESLWQSSKDFRPRSHL